MALYIATSLNDIAEQFERMADSIADRAMRTVTQRMRNILAAEANIWRSAAEMLRNTELKPAKEDPK